MKPTNEISKEIVSEYYTARLCSYVESDCREYLTNAITTALDRERERCEVLKKALEFYADEYQHSREAADPCSNACCGITEDGGKRARAALAEVSK